MKYGKVTFFISFILCAILYACLYGYSYFLRGENNIQDEFRSILPIWIFNPFLSLLIYYFSCVGNSLEIKYEISIFGIISGVFLRAFLAYLFCVVFEIGLPGVFMAKNIDFFCMTVGFAWFVLRKDLSALEGVN